MCDVLDYFENQHFYKDIFEAIMRDCVDILNNDRNIDMMNFDLWLYLREISFIDQRHDTLEIDT
jgi:hypothetical protein